jgi:hypothetical protein
MATIEELLKAQEQTETGDDNQMWGKAVLALAPILAGAALGGAQGGATGAEASKVGLLALSEKEKAEKEKKEKALERAMSLAKEERASKAEKRAEERQIAELGLKKRELEIKESEAKKGKEPSGPQFSAGLFARRIEQAEQVFDQLAAAGYNRAERKLEGILPGEMQSDARRSNDQAERNFVNAVLRRESGAAISKSEFESAEEQYFPRPGDSPEVIAQKKANRMQALAGLQAEAGRALERIPLVAMPAIMAKKAPSPLPSGLSPRDAVAAEPNQGKPDFSQMTPEQLRRYLGK